MFDRTRSIKERLTGHSRTGTVRWGVAGPGGIAARFAEAMRLVADGEITAVASRSLERADTFADRFGVRSRYDRYEALGGDPEVDVVYVATPHARHASDTITLLQAGKHVLCEKPFALNAALVRRMVDTARTQDRFLMEAMWSRFLPAYRRLQDILESGRIGEPLLVEGDFGFRVPFMPEHRLFDLTLGGGALLDIGIYPVQLCSLVLGAPDRVVADAALASTGADEVVAAVLHHRTGALGVVKAGISVATSCAARISGTEGWIELPAMMHCPTAIVIGDPAEQLERIDAGFDGDGLRFQIEEVHRCLAVGRRESSVMPLDESMSIAGTLDTIREQIGLVYPGE